MQVALTVAIDHFFKEITYIVTYECLMHCTKTNSDTKKSFTAAFPTADYNGIFHQHSNRYLISINFIIISSRHIDGFLCLHPPPGSLPRIPPILQFRVAYFVFLDQVLAAVPPRVMSDRLSALIQQGTGA